MKKVLIDVREIGEFNDAHLNNAINIPSSEYTITQYQPYRDYMIQLICHSGGRAQKVMDDLVQNGFQNVHVMDWHMEDMMHQNIITKSSGWSIDRQFRMTLGILLLIFLLGFYFLSSYFIIIPIILCCGLIFTSLIDRCYMRMAIAQLPWNKNKRM